MVQRVISILVLLALGVQNLVAPIALYAATTNGAASPWTREKAEHLARKALIGATPTAINNLYQAGSAAAAVNLLFPDAVGPDRTAYDAEVTTLTSSGFSFGNEGNMRKLYQLRYYRDPYEAKVKLFSLYEDIFSVNQSDTISYVDIKNQHDLLYSNALGNYKTLVKRILYNNGQPGDYAEGKFLDLLDQSNKNSPNENYARELLQLFLMGEYKPGESKEAGSIRNYEETDVAALAKILTGLRSDPVTHLVSYDTMKHNTSSGILFLSGTLASNPFSSFYDSASGTLDLALMETSLLWNNGLTDNAIDYIFAQRSEAISLFLADRLFRFYVHGKPTRSDLDPIAANIRANGFEMLPSVRSLLSGDALYSDASMNAVAYKNPLELTIGTLKILHDRDPSTFDPRAYDTELLNMLGWRPHFPGSVFGREGFDDTEKWFTAYSENQWISFSTRLASTTATGSYLLSNIVPATSTGLTGTFPIATSATNTYSGSLSIMGTGTITLGSGTSFDYNGGTVMLPDFRVTLGSGTLSIDQGTLDIANNSLAVSSGSMTYSGTVYASFSGSFPITVGAPLTRESSVDEIIGQIEDSLLSSRRLPEAVKEKIRAYATTSSTGATIPFAPSATNTQNTKVRGIVALALASPESILQTGYDALPETESLGQSPIANSSNKIVFIELSGGYDWLHGVIQKDQYATYQQLRTNSSGTIAISPDKLTDLGDFYMNNALAYSGANGVSLKSLYDSNNLRIFNRVGTFQHSRDHDAAQKQSTSYSNTTLYEDDGAFGHIIKSESDGSNTISLSGKRPNIFRNGNYINIGPSGAIFTNHAPIATAEKTNQLNLFRDVFATRSYPGTSHNVFRNAAKIDQVATASVANGGPNGAGWGNANNFAFLRSLLQSNVGKAFFLQGDGGYDTHSNQLAPSSNFDPNNVPRDLNYNVGRVVANATAFFNSVKATENITIIIYSEFGRTIRVNGDLGTDHGEGGGMFVLSNNPTLQASLPEKIYGKMDLLREKSDWLGVGIDYRSVYGKLYNALYGLSDSNYFTARSDLGENMDTLTAPRFTLARNEFRPGYNNNNARLVVPFRIEDPNFSMDYGSNLKIEYGTGFSNLRTLNQWSVDNYVRKPGGNYLFDVGVFTKNTPYVYRITATDNQFRETVLTGSLRIPDIRVASASTGTLVSSGSDTIVYAHSARTISGTIPLSGNTAITLASNGTGTTSTIPARDGITVSYGTGVTRVDSLSSASGSVVWNGGYILGEAVRPDFFLSSGALTSTGIPLSGMNVEKIVKVGADTLGVQMNLNQDITIGVPGLTSTRPYTVLRSEDGMNWMPIGTGSAISGTLSFRTSTLSYFAFVSSAPPAIVPPVVTPPVVTPPSSGGGGGWGGGGISRDNCPSGDSSPSYYDGRCGTASVGTGSVNTGATGSPSSATPPNASASGLFANNPVIAAYPFPANERIPQKVVSELNFIMTKVTKLLDRKAWANEAKKAAYYRSVDTYLLGRIQKTGNEREKRMLGYLRTRLAVVSKGLLTGNPPTPIPPAVVRPSVSIPAPIAITKVPTADIATPSASTSTAPTLAIDLDNPILSSYDYAQDKRFPRTITALLNAFASDIATKIDSNPSASVRKQLYGDTLSSLEKRIQAAGTAKEQKILRYMYNRVYIREQENRRGY